MPASDHSISSVRLLFDEARPERDVDALLGGGALIVLDVDRTRELDELRVEAALAFLVTDAVFDVPQPLVDGGERGFFRRDVVRCEARGLPAATQRIELGADV